MTQREFLLEFLKFHYRKNPFRRQETNEKDIEDFVAELPANTEAKNLSSNTMLADRLPNAEDVKRWYQLLVGKSEEAMQKDIEATFR